MSILSQTNAPGATPPVSAQSVIDRLKRAPEVKQTGSRNELGQADFLKLMTEQLKAQDPSSPQDSSEFISQMSQFATVTGIQGLQQSVDKLTQSLQSTQALQASSLVGREVLLDSNQTYLPESGAVSGRLAVPPGASEVNLSIENARGEQVFSQTLVPEGRSTLPFEWQGLDSLGERQVAGIYQIRAEAQVSGRSESLAPQVGARVESVSLATQGNGLSLNLAGLGQHPATDVTEIR